MRLGTPRVLDIGLPGLLFAITATTLVLGASPSFANIRITEVLADPVGPNSGNQKVEITNIGVSVVDISGYRICVPFVYRTFQSNVTLGPGEIFTVHIRAEGVNDDNNFYTGALFPALNPAGHSFILYLPGISTIDFGNAAFLVDYVEWGGPQPRQFTAVTAGAWVAGTLAPLAGEGSSMQLCDPATRDGIGWLANPATLGVFPNDCTLPKIILNEVLVDPVGPDSANQKIEIKNLDSQSVDISNWQICYNFFYWPLPLGTVLAPGGLVVVHLGAAGVNDAGNKYTGAVIPLALSEALGLYLPVADICEFEDSSKMMDFVQWGASTLAREDVAVAAGLWSAGDFLASPAMGRSLERCSPVPGLASWGETPDLTLGADNSCSPVSVPEGPARITRVSHPAPNPTMASTRISFELSRPTRIQARVIDIRGRVVSRLADRVFPAGLNNLVWNVSTDAGGRLAPGAYLVQLRSPDGVGADGRPWETTLRVVYLGSP